MYRRAAAAAILLFSGLPGLACGSSTTAPAPIIVPTAAVPTASTTPTPLPPPEPAPPAPAPVVSAEPPFPPETPPPPADYQSFADVAKAGNKAKGKMVRLRVRRAHYTSATQFTALPCLESVPLATLWLYFQPEHRDWVRPMSGTDVDACATASFRVFAFRGGPAPLVEGKIEHIGTVQPRRAAKPEPGSDYATIDDAILAGAEAKGKIIAGDFWAYDGNPKELWVHDYKQSDAFLFVIPKTPAQRSLASQLSTTPRTCGHAQLRMVDPDYVAGGGGESLKRPLAEVVRVP